jgi:hypothetical protein
MASEFVRRRTKGPNDEHLAELLQTIDTVSERDSLAGDAIRKKGNISARVIQSFTNRR